MENIIEHIVYIAQDIYKSLGPGYNEVIYHRAFEVALRLKGINYESEVITPVMYNNHIVGHGRVDIKIGNSIILEFKAISHVNNDAVIQIKNYMKYYLMTQGLVINFGQCTKNNAGSLDIIYINGETIFHFIEGMFQLQEKTLTL
jgi:GxxExxY protein